MTSNRSLLFALLLLPLLLTVAGLLQAQPPAPAAPPVDIQPQRRTVVDIRQVGTAMLNWLTEQIGKDPVWLAQQKPVPTSAPFDNMPVLSHAELTKLLVPRYIASVPEKDGWGQPYEFRMNVTNPNAAEHVIALRSPGQDGQFSAETYDIGGYFHDEVSQDLAWMDGYFVRWPEGKQPAK